MCIGIQPKPEDFFPTESFNSLGEVLQDCDSTFVLTILSKINAYLFYQDNFYRQGDLLFEIFQEVDHSEKIRILDCYKTFTQKFGEENVSIFSLFASMKVVTFCIYNYLDNGTLTHEQQIIRVFKAILFINKEIDDEHGKNKSTDIYELLLPAILPQTEYTQPKRIDTELFLSFGVLNYLVSTYSEYVPDFNSKYELGTPNEYIKKVLFSFFALWDADNLRYHSILQSDEYTAINECWIQNIPIADSKLTEEKVIKTLREKPFLRFKDGSVCIPNFNFIIDKFRNGLLFDFLNGTGLKNKIEFNDFKNQYGDNYSEKQLFYGLLDGIFGETNHVILKSDTDIDNNFDYYLRIDNKILLFEFKDYLMNDKTKNSGISKIDNYVQEHFISNERSKAKGVTQLINTIKQLNNNINCFEDIEGSGIDKGRIIIFPIIVFSDNSFSIPVLNHHLSKEFSRQMKSVDNDLFMIYDPVMIHINTIIEQIDFIKAKPSNILSLIINYKQYLGYRNLVLQKQKNANNILLAMSSFDSYVLDRKDLIISWDKTYAFNESKKMLEELGLFS